MAGTRTGSFGHLPAASSQFVGRVRELERISALLLDRVRLITLVGSGGIGKTRLAAEAAHRYRRGTGVPVYWVRLARLPRDSAGSAIEEEVVQSVLDVDFSSRSAWNVLVDTLTRADAVGRNLQTVLVMDNCEHVLLGAGDLIAELLDVVPGLTILATSREAVGWVDERLVAVPALTKREAESLFEWRARLVGHPGTAPEQADTVASICRQVHNNPLYIQLAAARLRYQPLAAVLRELSGTADDRRMRWSHRSRIQAESRHQGVADVIAWSYDLCSDEERLLLDRMSVFATGHDTNPDDEPDGANAEVGADLEAIEIVCADEYSAAGATGDPALSKGQIAGLLERLVDQSLVIVHIAPTTVRYSLLESIRVFAAQRLRERGADEPARLERRHRRYYRDKISVLCTSWYSPAELEHMDWARAAWGNLRVAIEGSLATGEEAPVGLKITVGLLRLRVALLRGTLRETWSWTERTLRATADAGPEVAELRIDAMAFGTWITQSQGRAEDSRQMLEQCVAASIVDPAARQDWRAHWDIDLGLPPLVEYAWGSQLMMLDRDARAITVLGRAREKFMRAGDLGGAAMSELVEALAAGLFGTPQQALSITRRHHERVRSSGAKWATAWSNLTLAIALARHGDPVESLAASRTALAGQLEFQDPWGEMCAVQIRMWALARLIEKIDALDGPGSERRLALATEITRLAGGLSTLRTAVGVELAEPSPFTEESGRVIGLCREVLGEQPFTAVLKQGARLRPEAREVQRLALGTLPTEAISALSSTVPRSEDAPWNGLTTAEQEVALLAAAGFTNTAIAARRGSSFRTVDAQMTAILQKLVIGSRTEIVRFVPKYRIEQVRSEAARRRS
ncbi:helix-turn-helix transcriptional regulator [Nocardia brasiliensis]|uniref:helix-turn-helix transcriptional regulator n=1 Tax=Nocardia brasiliensis TaxID=37326 RepID=UPI002456D51E|nr:AAA family ATPase [Nocardia brasiliensis]